MNNKQFKGTPGPWEWAGITQVATGRGHYYIVPKNNPNADSAIAKSTFGGMSKEDAQLIAAAPELLEALIRTQDIFDAAHALPKQEIIDRMHKEYDVVNTAIHKALGE